MCLIVDVNMSSTILTEPMNPLSQPVWKWLESGDGRIVYGGHLTAELRRNQRVRLVLLELFRAGKAHSADPQAVAADERIVRETGHCRSDDPHVIALARVSGARRLCSLDHALASDFKDPRLLDRPRGKVYQRPDHAHLLTHSSHCPGARRTRTSAARTVRRRGPRRPAPEPS